MSWRLLDDVDKAILYALQQDARNATTREIGDQVGVTASTVSNRIAELKDDGIITNYLATLDYSRAGFPMHVLIHCDVPVHDRKAIAHRTLDIPGVVNVRELMSGTDNIRIEAVGETRDDITGIVSALSEEGVQTTDEILIQNQYFQPLSSLEPEGED